MTKSSTTTIYGGKSDSNIYTLLVTGDRYWDDSDAVFDFISSIHKSQLDQGNELHIVHGGAKGADLCADIAAQKLQIPCHRYPAPWKRLGRSAGPKRNQLMIDRHEIDSVLVFHDDLENSKGTKNMVKKAEALGKFISHVSHD